jgi:hypothetical protein
MMRGLILSAIVLVAACGDGGPAPVFLSLGPESPGTFSPMFERAHVRLGERSRTGPSVVDDTLDVAAIASRCDRVCRAARACAGGGALDRCISGCNQSLTGGPRGCALPVLDVLICGVDAICALPLDQRFRARERLLSCGAELDDLAAAQPNAVIDGTLCAFPDIF